MKVMLERGLIVSCQALEDEPLHSAFIMGRMALAAKQGGAVGIRANSVPDIEEIKKAVDLPIIGIIKRDYEDSDVYITATMKEITELVNCGVDVIALDATGRLRPNAQSLENFFELIKEKYPEQLLMADCSTLDEAVAADRMGFDYIGTTMIGYTSESRKLKVSANDFEIVKEILQRCQHSVIAEGNIDTPEKAKRVLELGCHSVVVGGAITRPKQITEKFIKQINQVREFKNE